MKRTIALVLAVFLAAGIVAAQNEMPMTSDPLMAPGDLAISVGIGYKVFLASPDFSAGVELILGGFNIGNTLPLTFGVGAKAGYYAWRFGVDNTFTYLGVGLYGSLHLSLRDLSKEEIQGFWSIVDCYIGFGAGFYGYTDETIGSTANDFIIGVRSTAGFNFFLTRNLALNVEGGFYGGWAGALVGILLKF